MPARHVAGRLVVSILLPFLAMWRAIGFSCASKTPSDAEDRWMAGACTLAVEVTNDSPVDQEIGGSSWCSRGGREVDATAEGTTRLPPGATTTLCLESTVVADVPLTRPVLLRQRRWRLLRKEHDVIDHALWPRR